MPSVPIKEQASMQEKQSDDGVLLRVRNLQKYYPIQKGFLQTTVGHVKAVDGIDLYVKDGETLGLVGESGCGKTSAGRCILRAIEPTGGEIFFRDPHLGMVDIRKLNSDKLYEVRRNTQMIFQDPYGSLNPRMTLLQIVSEPLRSHRAARGKELEERVAYLLKVVGLRPEYMVRYPHAFSGGQRQRIGIARALALNPRFIVCDEPVSALDVSIQAQTLNLLQDLQGEFHLTYLFIAHDLSVVEHISDRVAVMYVGKLVEMAETEQLFGSPKHPYTEALMSSAPRPNPRARPDRIVLTGEVADPANPPSGCYFHPRCRYAIDVCRVEPPALRDVGGEHFVSCHRAEELELRGTV
jgi:peptide/nickel transport system ATP-binding protein